MVKLGSILFVVCTSLHATCYGPARESHTPALLRVHATPQDAHVRIDEQITVSARTLAASPRPLHVGHHRITLEAPGYFPHDLEVDLPEGETSIDVSLRPIPP